MPKAIHDFGTPAFDQMANLQGPNSCTIGVSGIRIDFGTGLNQNCLYTPRDCLKSPHLSARMRILTIQFAGRVDQGKCSPRPTSSRANRTVPKSYAIEIPTRRTDYGGFW
jgi:hypothetical protein